MQNERRGASRRFKRICATDLRLGSVYLIAGWNFEWQKAVERSLLTLFLPAASCRARVPNLRINN